MESKKVTWGRPEKSPFGSVKGYRSKCGRFYIERREYELPFVCVGYNLFYVDGGKEMKIEGDTLRDAKESAESLTEEGLGYVLSKLPEGFKK